MNGLLALHDVEQLTARANTVILIKLAVLDLSPASCAEVPGFENEPKKKMLMQTFLFKKKFAVQGNWESMRPLGCLG